MIIRKNIIRLHTIIMTAQYSNQAKKTFNNNFKKSQKSK